MKCADIPTFATYLLKNQNNMPVDLLAAEWFLGVIPETKAYFEDRQYFAGKFNLLTHIGDVSTFKGRARREFVKCGDHMKIKGFVAAESFAESCGSFDMSPCDGRSNQVSLPSFEYAPFSINSRVRPAGILLGAAPMMQGASVIGPLETETKTVLGVSRGRERERKRSGSFEIESLETNSPSTLQAPGQNCARACAAVGLACSSGALAIANR